MRNTSISGLSRKLNDPTVYNNSFTRVFVIYQVNLPVDKYNFCEVRSVTPEKAALPRKSS